MSRFETPPRIQLNANNVWNDTATVRKVQHGVRTDTQLNTEEMQHVTVVSEGMVLMGIPALRAMEKMPLPGHPGVSQATMQAGMHTKMYEHVSESYCARNGRHSNNEIENPCLRQLAKRLQKWEKSKPTGTQRIAFCPGAAAPSARDVIHPHDALAGGYMILSSKPKRGYVYTGVSSNLPEREKQHQRALRRMLNGGGIYNPDDVSFLDGDKLAMYKIIAAGCLEGNPPVFIVLFELKQVDKRLLDGDARPWRHILQNLTGPTGETLANKIMKSMMKTESALMNRLQTSAATYNTVTDQWGKTPRRPDGRMGLNGSTVQSKWDTQKRDEIRTHYTVRKATKSEPSYPPFTPDQTATMALRTFVALFTTTTGPKRKGGAAGEVRAMKYARSGETEPEAAKAYLSALPAQTARDVRQILLHAEDCNVYEDLVLAKRTTATMLKRLNVRLKTHRNGRPTVVLHHLTPQCNYISAKTVVQGMQRAASQLGVFIPGEATYNLQVFWSFSKPLRLQMFNFASAGETKAASTPCNCHLFPAKFKLATNTPGISPGSHHVATNGADVVTALKLLGADPTATESLLAKLRMGARSRLLECGQEGLTTALRVGVVDYLKSQARAGFLDEVEEIGKMADIVTDHLVESAEDGFNMDEMAATTVPNLTREEKQVGKLLCELCVVTEAEKDANGVGTVCFKLYVAAVKAELASSHYKHMGRTTSGEASTITEGIQAKLLGVAAVERFHKAAKNKRAKTQTTAKRVLGRPDPTAPTTPDFASFRANLKTQDDVLKFRFISNPKWTLYFDACKLIVQVESVTWPDVATAFQREFDTPPDYYTEEEAQLLASLKRKPWTVWSTDQALETADKMLRKLNAYGINAEEPPAILAKDFSNMFSQLDIDFIVAANKCRLEILTGTTHVLIEVEYGPLRYKVIKLDKAGAHAAHKSGKASRPGVSLMSKEEYASLFEFLCRNSYTTFAGELCLQIFGVAMGLPCAPQMSVNTLYMFELLFVRDCIKKRAFKVLAGTADTFLMMDDMLTAGSTLHTHTYIEDVVSSTEDSIPGQPQRMVHVSGMYPRGGTGTPPRPLQLLFNIEQDLRMHPEFSTKHAAEVTALDFAVRCSEPDKARSLPAKLTIGCHTKLRMPKSCTTVYQPFTSAKSNVRDTCKTGLMQGEAKRLFGMARVTGEFTEVLAHRQLQMYLQGMDMEKITQATAAAMRKLSSRAYKRWKITPKEIESRTSTKLKRQWMQGTALLDVRNACRDFPGPQERPLCAPGDTEPLQNVNPERCHRTAKHWEVALPHALCEASWEKADVCFDNTGRACVKYTSGATLCPPGGYVYNSKDKYLHAPTTGHVLFLRHRGSTETNHKMYYSGPTKRPQ